MRQDWNRKKLRAAKGDAGRGRIWKAARRQTRKRGLGIQAPPAGRRGSAGPQVVFLQSSWFGATLHFLRGASRCSNIDHVLPSAGANASLLPPRTHAEVHIIMSTPASDDRLPAKEQATIESGQEAKSENGENNEQSLVTAKPPTIPDGGFWAWSTLAGA